MKGSRCFPLDTSRREEWNHISSRLKVRGNEGDVGMYDGEN